MKHHLISSLTLATALLTTSSALAEERVVNNTDELRAAVAAANPGDTITLRSGTYRLDGKLRVDRAGEPNARITLKGEAGALIESNTVEAIAVSAPYWTFEGLHLKGVCGADSDCEHAFHIVGEAHWTIVRDSVLQNFNAQIKGNGTPIGPNNSHVHPDDVLIQGCELFNDAPRQTSNPVTPIDVVGGRRWIVRANFIHDHAKAQGNKISYAAFFKGNSRDGIMERNLIACEHLHRGQVRLGLSLGGGGTNPDTICEDNSCTPEHQGGTLRNNIIANCPSDVGIYLNKAADTRIEHNTLYDTTGIDVRYASSDAVILDNLVSGRIRTREDGTITQNEGNVQQVGVAPFQGWFLDPSALDFTLVDGSMLVDVASGEATIMDDFCGNPRSAPFDIGAVEYDVMTPCDTSTTHPGDGGEPPVVEDMGHGMEPGEEMGMVAADMGSSATPDMGSSTMEPGEEMGVVLVPNRVTPTRDMGATPDREMGASPTSPGAGEEDGCQTTRAGALPANGSLPLLVLVGGCVLVRRRRLRS